MDSCQISKYAQIKVYMLLSFVVPAYNSSPFIRDCLDSLLLQGLKEEDFEVIVVDDGSTDNTAEIVLGYCERNPNFKLFRQSNLGVGAARNTGLMQAHGRYVHFMDADDRLLPEGFGILINKFVIPLGFPDVISFWSRTVDNYYKKDEWETIRPYSLVYQGDLKEYGIHHGIGFSVWNQLISRKLITKNQLRFSDHKIGEDMLFMLHLYALKNAKLVVTNLNIYRYYVRENSAMNKDQQHHVMSVFYSLMNLTERIEAFGKVNCYPISTLDSYCAICQRWAYTRLCSAHLSYHELRACLDMANERDFFNISPSSSRLNKFIVYISKSAVLSYFFACFYGRIFFPYIKPWINRN